MTTCAHNLLKPEWAPKLDELRELLRDRIGEPGQTCSELDSRFYLPLAGAQCRVALRFDGSFISSVEPRPEFDPDQWAEISSAMDVLLQTKPTKVGRNIAFSLYRVTGWWRGERSGPQILSPPPDAPAIAWEMGAHPFILEVPLYSDTSFQVMNWRRVREHRRLTRLLNVLLKGEITCETVQHEHVWALEPDLATPRSSWRQHSYAGADFSPVIADALAMPTGERAEVVSADEYFAQLGFVGGPLRVPSDLDDSICRYQALRPECRERFNRALFWLDIASRHWVSSMSSSYAALVSAVEALTERGREHRVYCDECKAERTHHAPGPTALFKDFFETYAPGSSRRGQRDAMYSLRSSISHGSGLIAFDEDRAVGWDPPWSRQLDLHQDLWTITRTAVRNFLAAH